MAKHGSFNVTLLGNFCGRSDRATGVKGSRGYGNPPAKKEPVFEALEFVSMVGSTARLQVVIEDCSLAVLPWTCCLDD